MQLFACANIANKSDMSCFVEQQISCQNIPSPPPVPKRPGVTGTGRHRKTAFPLPRKKRETEGKNLTMQRKKLQIPAEILYLQPKDIHL